MLLNRLCSVITAIKVGLFQADFELLFIVDNYLIFFCPQPEQPCSQCFQSFEGHCSTQTDQSSKSSSPTDGEADAGVEIMIGVYCMVH